jgi:hypothetical protein
VATVDVRESILSHRLAALPADSADRTKLELQLAQTTEVSFSIHLPHKLNVRYFF